MSVDACIYYLAFGGGRQTRGSQSSVLAVLGKRSGKADGSGLGLCGYAHHEISTNRLELLCTQNVEISITYDLPNKEAQGNIGR